MRIATGIFSALALAAPIFAQQWELGGAGGVGVYTNKTVTRGSASATAGFKTGAAFGAFVAQNIYEHLGGEFRYTFQFDDLKVSSGSQEATFSGLSHAVHYDLLFYGAGRAAAIRPFLAAGGGVKVYRGTGKEVVSQPLGNFALLTKTQEVKGLISVGGGVRVKVGGRAFLYLEARDYMTPFPTQVIAPAPGAKLSGWVHDFVPMLGLSAGF